MTNIVVSLACAAVLLLACTEAQAAPQATPATPEAKPSEGEATKPDGEAAKLDEAAPSAATGGPETGPTDGHAVSLGDLTKDGFEIRATDFIPADAVTRHSGKVSADAVVVTLQKTNSTAVCFYTLKAYVGKKLTTISACTVHR